MVAVIFTSNHTHFFLGSLLERQKNVTIIVVPTLSGETFKGLAHQN